MSVIGGKPHEVGLFGSRTLVPRHFFIVSESEFAYFRYVQLALLPLRPVSGRLDETVNGIDAVQRPRKNRHKRRMKKVVRHFSAV